MIQLIENLDIIYNKPLAQGVSLFSRSRKWQPIHLRQGDMDGACSVYSLMMCLIVQKILTHKDVAYLCVSPNGRTSKGRLFKEFFVNEGFCRKGLDYYKIEDKLKHSFNKVVVTNVSLFDSTKQDQQDALTKIKESIDANQPIMIAIIFKSKSGHSILAIGYEEKNGVITKIFCLDPSYDIVNYAYWNTIIRVNDNPDSKFCHVSISENTKVNVYIQQALEVKKRKK